MAAKKTQIMSLDEKAEPKSISYRVERTSTFAWQAYRIIQFDEGSISEKPEGKPDTLDIVLRKINQKMRDEGQVKFNAAKATSYV